MVLEHIAQHADVFIKTGAIFEPDMFRHGDLNVINVITVPNRLKNGVGKARHEDVLDGFLAKIVVNAVYLALF